MKFRKGYKAACKYYVNLQWERSCVKKGYETLVEKLSVNLQRHYYK